METRIFPIVLSGGAGTRLWPLSRELHPKQLLALAGERSLIQDTVERVNDGDLFHPPIVVCNDAHRFIVAEQMRDIDVTPKALVLEPSARNTAPAAAAGALLALRDDPEAIILVLPSDHTIRHADRFLETVRRGLPSARDGNLVTFGIRPDTPETGYGYLKKGAPIDEGDGVFALDAFVEKPDAETALRFLADGEHAWNSGMFLFPAARYLSELERLEPDIAAAVTEAVDNATTDFDFLRLDATAFDKSPSKSIDYAVMEHVSDAVMVEADLGWSDLGAWTSLWQQGPADEAGNVVAGDVLLDGVTRSYIRADENGPMIAAIGLDNMVVVVARDAVLVAPMERSQDVRAIVERLREDGRAEAELHPRVYRPWGYYQGIDSGEHFQVKRIAVYPGRALSLQKHAHRAEHWVVVDGVARVTRDDEIFDLAKNESTYIPLGAVHRLENPGPDLLKIIEVQSGDYLGEDDIVRLDDQYGRADG